MPIVRYKMQNQGGSWAAPQGRALASAVAPLFYGFLFFFSSFEAFQSLLLSISIDPGTEKHNPSHRILMLVRQRTRWFVQHMLPHWLFITAARHEERLHPSSSSNEFLHAELNSVSGHLEWAVCEEDKDWAAIIAYYVTAVQTPLQRYEVGARRRTRTRAQEEGWLCFWACLGFSSVRRSRGPSVQTSSLSCRAHGGSMIKLFFHTVTQTNAPPLQCRQQPQCELCMYTNELCCCMLLWWLASPPGIDPGRVKTEWKEKEDEQRQAWHSTVALTPSSRSLQSCSRRNPMDLNFNHIDMFFLFFFFFSLSLFPSLDKC